MERQAAEIQERLSALRELVEAAPVREVFYTPAGSAAPCKSWRVWGSREAAHEVKLVVDDMFRRDELTVEEYEREVGWLVERGA